MSAMTVVQREQAAGRETEGGRRPTGVSLPAEAAARPAPPDSEVPSSPRRRRLSVVYKLRVLERVETLRKARNGSLGAYLRAEGLYYSSVQKWFRQRDAGRLGTVRRGVHRKSSEALLRQNKALRRQNESLSKRLHKTELIVELQKKISEMMNLDDPQAVQRHAKAS